MRSGLRAHAKTLARKVVPFGMGLELLRLKRLPGWIIEARTMARRLIPAEEASAYTHCLARHQSPLERQPGTVSPRLQAGKEQNVALAARKLNDLVIEPNQIFSYHHAIGRPSRLRGFRPGLELRNGRSSQGVGGGCCQISNTLYLLALRAGMKIVERHRHGLDLFPDHERAIPFGCGATVFYNYADLRFENPLPQSVILQLRIEDRQLVAEILAQSDPGWTAEVYEVDHRFFRDGQAWVRENRIRRRFVRSDGKLLLDQEVACNRGRVLYEPAEELVCSAR